MLAICKLFEDGEKEEYVREETRCGSLFYVYTGSRDDMAML